MDITPDEEPFIDLVQVRAVGSFGTGLLVGPGIVLTALHCVADPKNGWRLRDQVGVYPLRDLRLRPASECHYDANVIWREAVADPPDVVVLALEGSDPPRARASYVFCELPRAFIGGSARGFPAASKSPTLPDGRVEHDQPGWVNYSSQTNRALTFQALSRPAESGRKGWAGLSGGPLFIDGMIVGVMREVPNGWDGTSIQAEPLPPLLRKYAELREMLGVEWPLLRAAEALRPASLQGSRHSRDDGGLSSPILGGLDSPLAQQVNELLAPLDIVASVFIPHYRRTVNSIRIPGLAMSAGLAGIIRELAALADARGTDRKPRGLLQFLKRLASEERLRQPSEAWLNQEAASQANTLQEIEKELCLEAGKKTLIVQIDVDAQGKISGYQPFLRHQSNGSTVKGQSYERTKILSSDRWGEFVGSLQSILEQFVVAGALSNLEIHFLCDEVLFNEPFESIAAPGAGTIGQQAVVVLRHRFRVLDKDIDNLRVWRDYAVELRNKPPSALEWLPVTPKGRSFPKEKNLCSAEFTLKSSSEKNLLHRLLRWGAPCIYLPGADALKSSRKIRSQFLKDLLINLKTFESLPNAFLAERTAGNKLACKAALVWDDPLINPFTYTEGPSTDTEGAVTG